MLNLQLTTKQIVNLEHIPTSELKKVRIRIKKVFSLIRSHSKLTVIQV